MILLLLPWILLTISLWTPGLGQTLLQENVHILYPQLFSNESVICKCDDMICDTAFWFRSTFKNNKVEYIGKCNYAGRYSYGSVNKTHFKLSKGTTTFVLQIFRVTEADRGVYSCVLKDKGTTEVWKPGTLLLPGVIPPTKQPKMETKPSVKTVFPCSEKKTSQDRCSPLVLWPLVGLISSFAVVLIYLLFYFSRLPKKCHHHFVKGR